MFSGRRVRDWGLSLAAGRLERSAATVFPGVHLFGDDVGFFTYAADEEFCGLEDGGADLAEAVAGEDGAGDGFDAVPEFGFRGE